MKVTYIAPRFHTNQIDTVKGWIDAGHQVQFISYYTSPIEDYSVIQPQVLGFSWLYEVFHYIYVHVIARSNPKAIDKSIKNGFPPVFKLMRTLRETKPDIVILRERSMYSIVAFFLMKKRAKCILYNQSPLWDKPLKKDFAHQLVYGLTPKSRYTPVKGREENGKVINPNTYYVPFVIDPVCSSRQRSYYYNGRINILCIGVFEERKNHKMMLEVFKKLIDCGIDELHLTLIGEATQTDQKQYLGEVRKQIEDSKLDNYVTVLVNQTRNQVYEMYKKTDLFVIPSTREPASISQLEAMSCSVPVVVSDTNGTACYVIEGQNGFLFEDMNADSLFENISRMISDRDALRHMGENAFNYVKENNSFENYYREIMAIIEDEEKKA